MRLLTILPSSPPSKTLGGAQKQVHSIHKGLVERGVDVHVLAEINEVGIEYQEYEGVKIWGVRYPVLTLNALRPGNIKFWIHWRNIRRIVLKNIPKPDLICVSTFRQSSMFGYWLSKTLHVPWIVRMASNGENGDISFIKKNWLSSYLYPHMMKSVAAVVTLSEEMKRDSVMNGLDALRIQIIKNGIILKRERDQKISRDSVVFVGRLASVKRIDTLLKSFRDIYDREDVKSLVIAGDGELSGSLREMAITLGIHDKCEFTGAISGPEEILDRALCFVNPSEREGLPNTVLEALAFGVPVILSDIPVHREIAACVGMEQFLFPVGNNDVLSEKINKILNLEPSDLLDIKNRCYEYSKQYSIKHRDDKYYNLCTCVINGNSQ